MVVVGARGIEGDDQALDLLVARKPNKEHVGQQVVSNRSNGVKNELTGAQGSCE